MPGTSTSERSPLLGKDHTRPPSKVILPFVLCLFSCVCSGSLSLFSLYTAPFTHELHFTQIQCNIIAIAGEVGMYLPVPVLGYFGDKYGQSKNAILMMLLYTPSYLYAAYIYGSATSMDTVPENTWLKLAICFASIGVATSALAISCLSSCARMLPQSTGLAISLPVTAFGLSALLEAQLIPRWFSRPNGILNLEHTFVFFAILYFFCGVSAYSAIISGNVDKVEDLKLSVEDTANATNDYDDEEHEHTEPEPEHERTHEPGGPAIILPSKHNDHLSQRERFALFIIDHETWILMAAFILISGPLEMYLNNINALLSTVPGFEVNTSTHVSIFATFSTIARLSTGIGSDYARPVVSTATILTIIGVISGLTYLVFSTGDVFLTEPVSLVRSAIPTAVSGFAYGTIFTLYPTMIAKVWGVKSFGTNWGLFVLAPAIGSLLFGVIFASLFEKASYDGQCIGPQCYSTTFSIVGSGFLVSAFIVFGLWQYSWKHARIVL